jgi:hypothetical protein
MANFSKMNETAKVPVGANTLTLSLLVPLHSEVDAPGGVPWAVGMCRVITA